MLEIEYVEKIDKTLGEMIGVEFDKYAAANGIDCNYLSFVFVAKDNNEIVGAITGNSYYNVGNIVDLIVKEGYRDRHIGSQLMGEFEKYCGNKGLSSISVTTHRFQAPDFYKKHGFEIEFIRENKENPKLDKYFLVKYY